MFGVTVSSATAAAYSCAHNAFAGAQAVECFGDKGETVAQVTSSCIVEKLNVEKLDRSSMPDLPTHVMSYQALAYFSRRAPYTCQIAQEPAVTASEEAAQQQQAGSGSTAGTPQHSHGEWAQAIHHSCMRSYSPISHAGGCLCLWLSWSGYVHRCHCS
jgi:hypothetical protein